MVKKNREIMDLKEIAKYLDFSEKKIYNLIKTNSIPYCKIGGQYRFVKETIDKWLKEKSNHQLYLTEEGDIKNLLRRLKEILVPLERRLFLVGILTKVLEEDGVKPIVVGGNAVEFYTLGGYATADIDLVISDYEALDKALTSFGFKKEGKHWVSLEFDLVVESPSSNLAGDYHKLTEVEIQGLKIYIIGIEDIIIDRLNAFVYWKSEDDKYWAKEMLYLHYKEIDWRYLSKRAKEEKINKEFQDLKWEVKKLNEESKL